MGDRASERIMKDGSSGMSEEYNVWSIDTPKIPGRFTGTGDITAALILAWTTKIKDDLKGTLERIASTMYALIKYTAEHSNDSIASRELKLIQSKNTIENPTIQFEARKVI